MLCMALAVEAQAHVLVNKADKGLHSVQEGLKERIYQLGKDCGRNSCRRHN
jgi:hypothetical protein